MEYWGNSYGYGTWGNLLQKTPTKCSAENLSVTALANNQFSGYGYDAAGNMTHDATTGNNYLFDVENRIVGTAGFIYTYDADGNRVEKSNGSTGTIYWYMSPGIVAESDLSGDLQSEYVFFDGERVARKDFPTGAVSYYFSDHLKTASVITDSAGNIKEDEDYYPWGGELQFANGDSNHYKFTGKERDLETGLDYFGARYYGSWYGRFLSADWAAKPEAVPYSDLDDPQSLNLYSYVRNVPTSRADPDGHFQQAAAGTLTAAVAACAAAEPCGVAAAGVGVAAAPLLGMAVAATLPPMQNTPDGSPNLILDALNPPYIPAPPLTTTNPGQTTVPASTSTTAPTSTTTNATATNPARPGTLGNQITRQQSRRSGRA